MINKKDSSFLGEVVNSLGEQSYDVLENLLGKASNDKVILPPLEPPPLEPPPLEPPPPLAPPPPPLEPEGPEEPPGGL